MHRAIKTLCLISLFCVVSLTVQCFRKSLNDSLDGNEPYSPPLAMHYEAILQSIDLSNAKANEYGFLLKQSYPTAKELPVIQKRIADISRQMSNQGWNPFRPIFGRTGRFNIDPDLAAIVQTHSAQRLIIVAFHSSRSGHKNPIYHDGKGDWGSNFDAIAVSPKTLSIPEMPDTLRVHRGFGNCLASARVSLLNTLDQEVKKLGRKGSIRIWVTGHSKGGAIGGLATGMIQSHFRQDVKNEKVQVGGIFFSSPRAFQGDDSQRWIHQMVGRRNLFQIQVAGDPVPWMPLQIGLGYRSIGFSFRDSIQNVYLRRQEKYTTSTSNEWLNFDSWANYHYGCGLRGIGYEFDPSVVIRYTELWPKMSSSPKSRI